MDTKLKNKIISLTFSAVVFLMAVCYFGLIISSFNKITDKKSETASQTIPQTVSQTNFEPALNNTVKEEAVPLASAAFADRPAYYTYSAADGRFYGPFDRNEIKEGDYYMEITAPQGQEAFSAIYYYDKDRNYMQMSGDNICATGIFYYADGVLYMKDAGQLYKIRPDLNFACSPVSNEEYRKYRLN